MREDETEQRLETLFALPVRRARWFAERLLLAAAAAGAAGAGGRGAGLGRRGVAGRRRVAGADDRGGRQLPAGDRAVPGPRRPRPRARPAGGSDDRLRARRGGLPVGDDRRADRGARLGDGRSPRSTTSGSCPPSRFRPAAPRRCSPSARSPAWRGHGASSAATSRVRDRTPQRSVISATSPSSSISRCSVSSGIHTRCG